MSEGDAGQLQPDSQPQDSPAPAPAEGPRARAELPAPAAGPGSGPGADRDQRKGGDAAGLAAGGDAPAGEKPGSPPNVADHAEENLDERSDDSEYPARQLRADVPDSGADLGSSGDQATFNFNGAKTTVGDVAGRDMYHQYYSFYASGKERARGPISIAYLTRVARVHVRTDSDDMLQMMCGADRVVLLRGRRESGRQSSAVRILDALTGGSRGPSMVSVVEASSGLDGLARRLAEGHGHLLDASAEDWLDAITEAQGSTSPSRPQDRSRSAMTRRRWPSTPSSAPLAVTTRSRPGRASGPGSAPPCAGGSRRAAGRRPPGW